MSIFYSTTPLAGDNENNYLFRALMIFSLNIVNFSYILFVSNSLYAFFMYSLFGFFLLLKKEYKLDYLLSYVLGILIAILFYEYWVNFYDGEYFLGRKSDDWQYDVYWSSGYIERYGISPFYLTEHLNGVSRNLGLLHNSKGYVYLVILFRWFGEFFDGYNTLVPRFFNVYLLVLCAGLSVEILKKIYNGSVGRVVIYIITLFPVMIYTSVHVFRDILVALLILIYINNFLSIRFIINNKRSIGPTFRNLLFIAISLALLLTLRTSVVIMLVLLSVIAFLPKKQLKLLSLIVAPLALIIFFNNFNDEAQEIVRLSKGYDELNTSRFGFIGSQVFELPKWIGFLPRMSYLILTPVPSFSSFHQFFTSISAIFQVLFLPSLIAAVFNKGIDSALKVFFLGMFFAVAMSTATFRHVVMYIPLGIMLVFLQLQYVESLWTKGYLQKLILCVLFLILTILMAVVL